MKILLYNPDNGVTRNFMPHLWMFLLQSLTPPEHEVLLIDGNARPMNEQQLVSFIREQKIGLVGIDAMTRMVARAYRMADAIHAAGWSSVHSTALVSGRGWPYGCVFGAVSGFSGGSSRFRSNGSGVAELWRLKKNVFQNSRQVVLFFIVDSFAIRIKRTQVLLI